MITLSSDCLLFEIAGGESVPLSAEMISVDVSGDSSGLFSDEFMRQATKAVFHYFRAELGRQTVSMAEFAEALEKVLTRFSPGTRLVAQSGRDEVFESDLSRLAQESGGGCELFFFPRLRDLLRKHLRSAPRLLRFRRLRQCVRELTGARRWTPKCRSLEEQILEYLRQCVSAEGTKSELSLLVD
jgi:hypothetical protein